MRKDENSFLFYSLRMLCRSYCLCLKVIALTSINTLFLFLVLYLLGLLYILQQPHSRLSKAPCAIFSISCEFERIIRLFLEKLRECLNNVIKKNSIHQILQCEIISIEYVTCLMNIKNSEFIFLINIV